MGDELNRIMDKMSLRDEDFFKKGTRSAKNASGATNDRANRATTEQVLDPRTRMILFRMINRGVFDSFRGCLSTGKEANVYRATTDDGLQRAVKVYKTSILVFKDRDRYVTGEFRFRFGYSRHNPRKMVKLWAEKETRNLKRIWKSGIPVPKPLHLSMHVLVMEFLGDDEGWPSPKLKDASIEPERYEYLYFQVLAYMRIMYQQCRLVHADLSEYNILYHQEKLWIIDVSQSVEHDHPSSLEFLRMDIKNVNDYFQRQNVKPFSERRLFKFITTPQLKGTDLETVDSLIEQLREQPEESLTEQELADDAVFRSIYIPKTLNEVFDIDRDVERVQQGESGDLIYKDLLQNDSKQDPDALESEDESESDSEYDSDSDSDEDEEEEDEITDVWDENWEHRPAAERKFVDRDANKERKKQIKEERKQKRAVKMKKKDKKKLIANSKSKGKTRK